MRRNEGWREREKDTQKPKKGEFAGREARGEGELHLGFSHFFNVDVSRMVWIERAERDLKIIESLKSYETWSPSVLFALWLWTEDSMKRKLKEESSPFGDTQVETKGVFDWG